MKLKFQYQLILYYFFVIVGILLVASIYMMERDKDFSIKSLERELSEKSDYLYSSYIKGVPFDSIDIPSDIRITVLDNKMVVVYDTEEYIQGDYASCPEIVNALKNGEGTILRHSASTDLDYLYFAKKYPYFVIRTAKVYELADIPFIVENKNYQYLTIALILLLVISLVYISKKLTKPLKAFTQFSDILLTDNRDFSSIKFPHNEYGEIGKTIIDTFDQLEKTKKYKQQMSHNIAHELKTPVTGIRAYLETILHDDNMDKEQTRRFAEKAYNQTIRLSSLINDVSILNKIEEGAAQFPIEDVNITECLNDIQEEIGYKLKANNIELNIHFSSSLTIKGNYQLIYSLFKNLIDNTIEHAGPNNKIDITAGINQRPGDKSYRISFNYSDTGKGVPSKDLERLFERFYRVEKGRTRKTGGSGLGLSIVKNAVLFHKGEITVENKPEGGILFRFNLMNML